jgi:hypothetical protein
LERIGDEPCPQRGVRLDVAAAAFLGDTSACSSMPSAETSLSSKRVISSDLMPANNASAKCPTA